MVLDGMWPRVLSVLRRLDGVWVAGSLGSCVYGSVRPYDNAFVYKLMEFAAML